MAKCVAVLTEKSVIIKEWFHFSMAIKELIQASLAKATFTLYYETMIA